MCSLLIAALKNLSSQIVSVVTHSGWWSLEFSHQPLDVPLLQEVLQEETKERLSSSRNGLSFVSRCFVCGNARDGHYLYIANPMTKQQLLLPRFFFGIKHHERCGLAFVEASMKYKVVQVYRGFEYVKCVVLTIGVDKVWRHIDIEHLSITTKKAVMSFPWVCGGFMYLVRETVLLMMNVETEIVSQFPLSPWGKIPKVFTNGQ
ncbi:uncharacterized protein [Primulina eburnea]|uniref:uncharacterized protein n=1 Tax=Primulina eburnea TaxID=1245227 RepID=UPI003C6C0542